MEQGRQFTRNPRRLTGFGRKGRGPEGRFRLWAFFFVPFGLMVALGAIGLALWEFGLLPAPPQQSVPRAMMLCIAGAVFMFGFGLFLIFKDNLRSFFKHRKSDPSQPWFFDFDWNPREFRISSAGEVLAALYVLGFLALSTPPALILVALDSRSSVVLLFVGLAGVWMSITFVRELRRHLKYGTTWLRYGRFPFYPGEQIDLAWGTQRGFNPYNTIKFTLRYVEEERREVQRRDHIDVRYEPIELWAASFTIDDGDRFAPDAEQGMAFNVPANAPSTNLRGDPPSYWELEVEVDAPGANFQRTYGVPIYHRPPEQWAPGADKPA